MKIKMNAYDIGYSDETTLQVLKEKGRRADQTSYMWLFIGAAEKERCYIYEYHSGRSHYIAHDFWRDFKGYLHCDAYGAYGTLSQKNPQIKLVHCLAHARRKFIEITKQTKASSLADHAIKEIAKLYGLEKKYKEEKLEPEEIYQRRQHQARPILEHFKKWLDEKIQTTIPDQPLAKAMQYCLNIWPGLNRYLEDGRLEIDNNRSERSIKPFVIGRKNWLFYDSVDGAKAGSIIYSLIETCKAHKIEPYAYLKYALNQIRHCQSAEDYERLFPFNIQREQLLDMYH